MALFGGGARDRAHLVETLTAIGPTSVTDLSAALEWPARRTVRAIQSLAHSGGSVSYDPATGSVRAERSFPDDERMPQTPARSAAHADAPAAIAEAGDIPRPGACTICRTALSTTGTPGTFYCSNCGNLETRAGTSAGAPRPAPIRGPGIRREGGIDDRQAQEMFAAWATAQPIPCPRCRQPLAHRGIQSYACPACGEAVTFAETGVTETARPPS